MNKRLLTLLTLLAIFLLVGCGLTPMPSVNEAPNAYFTFEPANPTAGDEVTFNPTGTYDQEDSLSQLGVRWDFDADGTWEIDYNQGKRASQSVTKTFAHAGEYNVLLEVKDSEGLTSQKIKTVVVGAEPTPTYQIAGSVVASRGGAGIAHATVTLVAETGGSIQQQTGSSGEFAFEVQPWTAYELQISKAGYASSRALNLWADRSYSTDLSIPLRPVSFTGFSTNPPEVTVTGLVDGQTVAGQVDYTIEVTGDQALKLGEVQYGPQGYPIPGVLLETTPQSFSLDTLSLPEGETYLRVNAYDLNENYTEVYYHITVDNADLTSYLSPPSINLVEAYTTGSSLQLLSEESQQLLDRQMKSSLSIEELQTAAAESGSTLLVTIEWTPQPDVSGYRVYRSTTSATGGFSLIGVVTDQAVASFIDSSGVLTPGEPVYYKISSYHRNDESQFSKVISTTPLEPFRVSLVAPAHDGVVTTSKPTFSWSYDRLVGEDQYYDLEVWGVTDSISAIEGFAWKQTSISDYYGSLESGKEYEWNLLAYASTRYSMNSQAVSISNDNSTAMNGWYRFRTDF